MKIFTLWVLLTMQFATYAQRGIFITAADFQSRHLSYCKIPHQKYKWHLHELFPSTTLSITIGDSIYVLNKDDVFGYRDADGSVYRYVNRQSVEIINPSDSFLLYRKSKVAAKGDPNTFTYFFSVSSQTPVIPLNIYNLKIAFQNNPELIESIDVHFRNDSELMAYDNFYHCYKLVRLINVNHSSQPYYTTK